MVSYVENGNEESKDIAIPFIDAFFDCLGCQYG